MKLLRENEEYDSANFAEHQFHPIENDANYFVEKHFQKLIGETEKNSIYSKWLADALELLASNRDSFPLEETYFDPVVYNQITEWMKSPNSSQPSWLPDALEYLVDNIKYFPSAGDEDSYIVEYIYPH
jgi:hypothetical protein